MASQPLSGKGDDNADLNYACVGTLTISRAATTEREIAAMGDGMTIDLSGVSRMDTVGAWLVYRAVRDRNAKIVGESVKIRGLLDQVAEADRPVRVVPEKNKGGAVGELGGWVVETGRTSLGLLGFFGATLIGFFNVVKRPRRFRLNAVVQRFDVVGVRALAIIGLMTFLIGIVIGSRVRSSSRRSAPRFIPST